MYCSNCGALLYGYRNDEGKIKYECKRCGKSFIAISLYPFTAPLVIPLIICSWKRT